MVSTGFWSRRSTSAEQSAKPQHALEISSQCRIKGEFLVLIIRPQSHETRQLRVLSDAVTIFFQRPKVFKDGKLKNCFKKSAADVKTHR